MHVVVGQRGTHVGLDKLGHFLSFPWSAREITPLLWMMLCRTIRRSPRASTRTSLASTPRIHAICGLISSSQYANINTMIDQHTCCSLKPLPTTPTSSVDAFIASTGATIVHGGSRACFIPKLDEIHMPERACFTGSTTSTATEAYYSTVLHELTHWTAPKHRCNRDLSGRFGSDAYAMEELVAELGAAFLCAELGITVEPRPDHAQYLAHWLNVLKADKRAIFTAVSKAGEAAAFVRKEDD